MIEGKKKSIPKRVPLELVKKIEELKEEHPGMSDPEIMRQIFSAVMNDKNQMIGKMMDDIRAKLFSIFERKEDVDELMEGITNISPILNDVMNTDNSERRTEKREVFREKMFKVQAEYFEEKEEVKKQ